MQRELVVRRHMWVGELVLQITQESLNFNFMIVV